MSKHKLTNRPRSLHGAYSDPYFSHYFFTTISSYLFLPPLTLFRPHIHPHTHAQKFQNIQSSSLRFVVYSTFLFGLWIIKSNYVTICHPDFLCHGGYRLQLIVLICAAGRDLLSAQAPKPPINQRASTPMGYRIRSWLAN